MTDWDLISSYAGLLTLATTSIYAGAFGSLPNPPKGDSGEDSDDDEEEVSEHVSSGDAYLFPIIGSAALFGMYLVIKFFGTEWINIILGYYFSLTGIGSVWKTSTSFTRFLAGNERWKKFERYTFKIHKGSKEQFKLSLKTPSLYLLPIAVVPSALYQLLPSTRKSVLITDLLALSFSHTALALIKLDSFQTGVILLSGLFLYDIWWVFGTRVMVEVATKLDVPIKLLWPKSLAFSSARGFTMLGLGDVVVPGVFVALSLHYDYHLFSQTHPKARSAAKFPKPYFYASLTAYVSGLVTTMFVMHYFGKAQPALLYLSPACIMSFVLTALIRGELRTAWNWSTETKEAKEDAHMDAKKQD